MALDRSPFDDVAAEYDRARPTYPPQLFAELAERGGAANLGRVIEVGPGTGQATGDLLDRAAEVTAVELGGKLAVLLREKHGHEPRLRVLEGAFEAVALEPGQFDLVFAATAFHWIDPAVRLVKAHHLLADGGRIAIVETNQVRSTADRGFFARCQPIYQRYYPGEAPGETPEADLVPGSVGELEASGLFADIQLARYAWDQRYDAATYGDLVRSYSNTQGLEPNAREGLVADLCGLIEREFDGSIVRPLVVTLTTGRRA